jgi:undecaprenyl-diphosphatase
VAGRAIGFLVAGWAVTLGLVTAAGLAITSYGDEVPLLRSEDEVDRDFVGVRTPTWDGVTAVISFIGDTSWVAPATLVLSLVLRWVLHRWRESLFLAAAVIGHWVVFLTTTLLVERARPDVPHLDDAPGTSSFPSGHTGAALAFYGALAVIVARDVHTRWIRVVAAGLLLALPIIVAVARLYRGMHYPSDIAGSVLSSGLGVLLAYLVVLRPRGDAG